MAEIGSNLEDILARTKKNGITMIIRNDGKLFIRGKNIWSDILLKRHLQKPLKEQSEETINSLYDLILKINSNENI